MKKIFLPILYALYFILYTPHAHAASEFTTTFNSLYLIKNSEDTSVVHTITLKNNLSHIYATSYTIVVSGDKLDHITASDESGPITTSSSIQNGNTTIQLTIGNPKIGKDQLKTISLSYTTADVVERIGETITVNIPRLSRANEAESYTRIVKIEGTQDLPQHIYPLPNKTEPDGNFTIYTFDGHQGDSLTLLFGKSVTYKLDLTYELKNKEMTAGESELSLPPDTAYQHILLKDITPPPTSIKLDESGNWMARYNLKPASKLVVKAEIYATVYPVPTLYDPSSTNFVKTGKSEYWDTTSSVVTQLADTLKTPGNIYHYLTTNFTYNYDGVMSGRGRMGTLSALSSPTSVLCTEFTDVFVSLARARGIPAREINGYGYTKNSALQPQNVRADILHAWPEYYDNEKKSWISIDPTWGNTTGGVDYLNKLDFSHITFVRHGAEDSYPLPAGAYKSNSESKFVNVEIATELPEIDTTTQTRDGYIYNYGNVALINSQVGYLPPYGSYKIDSPKIISFYDKIRLLCAKLLSKFSQLLPASM